jgi:hypothetical protein
MIETIGDYNRFNKEIGYHDIMIFIIPSDDRFIHASASTLSAILVKDLETDKIYEFSFGHPDCSFQICLGDFITSIQIQPTRKVWCFDKKSSDQLLHISNYLDIDLFTHLQENWMLDLNSCETSAHKLVKRNNYGQRNINNIIPLLKHKEMFERMCDEVRLKVNFPDDLDSGYIKENATILGTLAELENTGIHVNCDCFKNHFPDAQIYDKDLVYSQYNIYTSTGRPSNRFDNVNYAALNKSDGSRKCFTSRYGEDGKMVLIDYSAFHPRIISYLIKFPLGIDTDIYAYLGELYFGRKVTEYDMDEIKSITMRQFYGGIEEKYQHIKYLNHAREFIEKYWEDFKKNGFIKTPLFGRVITDKHLLSPNPYKLLNYILQATETEVAISTLRKLQDLLINKKTKAVLYTYDSLLFDFYKPEGKELLDKIISVIKGSKFPVKIYEGDSYDSVVQTYL